MSNQQWEQFQAPTTHVIPSLSNIDSVVIYCVGKMMYTKADQLTQTDFDCIMNSLQRQIIEKFFS